MRRLLVLIFLLVALPAFAQYSRKPAITTLNVGMSIGGALTGGLAGSVIFVDGSGNVAQDNTNLVWDSTNKILTMKYGTFLQAVKLTPIAAPPVTCNAGNEGYVYSDTSHAFCWCDGSTWQKVSGAGTCS